MNGIDDRLARQLAETLMAHGLTAVALEAGTDASPRSGAGELVSLDEALAGRLADLGLDADTMAAAMACLALKLAALTASSVSPGTRA